MHLLQRENMYMYNYYYYYFIQCIIVSALTSILYSRGLGRWILCGEGGLERGVGYKPDN